MKNFSICVALVAALLVSACGQTNQRATRDTAVGAGIGAAAGCAVGSLWGNCGSGAAAGAIVGGVIGGVPHVTAVKSEPKKK